MLKLIKEKFLTNPLNFYGLSIAASWAGVGSLLNTVTMAKNFGVVPAMIWTLANIFACILFGIVIDKLPTLRQIVANKAVRFVITLMGVFHIWLSMNGMREIFSDTYFGIEGGTYLAYGIAGAFTVFLLWRGMIRNILTDSASWITMCLPIKRR